MNPSTKADIKLCRSHRAIVSCQQCIRYGDATLKGCPYKVGLSETEPSHAIFLCCKLCDITKANSLAKHDRPYVLDVTASLRTQSSLAKAISTSPITCYLFRLGSSLPMSKCLITKYDPDMNQVTIEKTKKLKIGEYVPQSPRPVTFHTLGECKFF